MKRYRYIDVLRGFAVLGIFPANVVLFALPIGVLASMDAGVADQLGRFAVSFFIKEKFLTLFSLLFGVGMYIFRERADAAELPSLRLLIRRLVALGLFGFFHILFLWFGDILWLYAGLGLLVCWCTRWPARVLYWVGAVLIAVPAIGMLVVLPFLSTGVNAPVAGPSTEEIEEVRLAATAPLDEFVAAARRGHPAFEEAVYREGSYARVLILRVGTAVNAATPIVAFLGWRVAGLFLVGMALARRRWFLEPDKHPRRFRMMLLGFVPGIPLQFVFSTRPMWAESDAAKLAAHLAGYVGSLAMAAGYAAVVGLLCTREPLPRWLSPFEAVGRTAFSNYILQSVIGVGLFYSFGLGLYGSFHRGELWLIAIGTWVLLLAWSPLWRRRYEMGPLEWVWRRLTYGRRFTPTSREVSATPTG